MWNIYHHLAKDLNSTSRPSDPGEWTIYNEAAYERFVGDENTSMFIIRQLKIDYHFLFISKVLNGLARTHKIHLVTFPTINCISPVLISTLENGQAAQNMSSLHKLAFFLFHRSYQVTLFHVMWSVSLGTITFIKQYFNLREWPPIIFE